MASVLKQFGRGLRRLRERKGLSQEALAFQAGLHRNSVGALERGEQNVSLLTLEKIARVLKVKTRELLPKN